MIRILTITLILLSQKLFCANFHDFDPYQHKLTSQEIEVKIKNFLEKDSKISEFYQLTPTTFYIGDLKNNEIDYILYLNPNPSLQAYKPNTRHKSLNGVKIAIDPGHFGGMFAVLERRYVSLPAEKSKTNQPICFHEGDLTYLTALKLKSLLEADGALTLVTRPGIGQGAIDEDFFKWLEKHFDLKKNITSMFDLFSFYNKDDLKVRAKKINNFCPDITIIIHYNAHLTDQEKDQKTLVTQSNYNLTFIPGAFCANELKNTEDRYEFLRLIVTEDIKESLKLSECIVKEFAKQLNVPLISETEKTSYRNACLIQKPGIYCRNLVLTRFVHSPVCYGETLIQNNEKEIYRLSAHDISIGGIPCSKRIEEVAQAYFKGIKKYFKN
jgi:N-acetylmuramoyl-L-alanine amidase